MFSERLKTAAADGAVLGVKWAMVLMVLAMMAAVILGDYSLVRQRAANGQQAFDFIQQQIAASHQPKESK